MMPGMTRAVVVVIVLVAATTAHAQAPGQAPPPPSVMARRWAVGLSLGSASLTPRVPGGQQSAFGVGELAVRFRMNRALELALALGGGGAKTGDLALGEIFVDARYRFVPDEPWNGYVLGGLGVMSAHGTSASDPETKGRGAVRIGGGVERRFGRFALSLELHLIAIAGNDAVADVATHDGQMAHYAVTGASLALGASLYF